jgi:hypothetical protein
LLEDSGGAPGGIDAKACVCQQRPVPRPDSELELGPADLDTGNQRFGHEGE